MAAVDCLVILVSHGSTGLGESRVTVVFWRAGSYACAIVCPLVYSGASFYVVAWCEDFPHFYVKDRGTTSRSIVDYFQVPLYNVHYLPVIKQSVYLAFFGSRIFHLRVLLL